MANENILYVILMNNFLCHSSNDNNNQCVNSIDNLFEVDKLTALRLNYRFSKREYTEQVKYHIVT